MRFRKSQAARTHRTQRWRGTTALAGNSESKTHRRNAFKLLEESNFRLVTISHAKILIERKRNVQISMTSKNLSPMYLGHRKALEERVHQHNRANPDRQRRRYRKTGPEQHEEPTVEGKRRQRLWAEHQARKTTGPHGRGSEGSQEDFSRKVTWIACLLSLNFRKGFNNLCEFWLNKL